MIGTNYKWYAIYVIRHHEQRICNWLGLQGIDSIFPIVRVTRFWSDRIKKIEQPLFPSYLFVKVSCKEYFKVLNNPSVIKYICFGGEAAEISGQQIESVRSLINTHTDLEVKRSNIKPGERVTIMHGPLSGLSGELITYNSNKCFLIRISEIGYSLIIKLSENILDNSSLSGNLKTC